VAAPNWYGGATGALLVGPPTKMPSVAFDGSATRPRADETIPPVPEPGATPARAHASYPRTSGSEGACRGPGPTASSKHLYARTSLLLCAARCDWSPGRS
jgi:hypothetical protein